MQNQIDIQMISNIAPPSYAQAMGPSVPMRDSPYVPVPGKTTKSDNQVDHSMVQNQQSHPTVASCIIPNEMLEPRDDRTFCEHCTKRSKKLIATFVAMIPVLFLMKLMLPTRNQSLYSQY